MLDKSKRMTLVEAKEKAKHRVSASVRLSTGSNLYSTVDTPGQPSITQSNPFEIAEPESKEPLKLQNKLKSIVEENSILADKELTESMELSRMLSGDSDS